jgi:hypothetical protein
MRYLEMAAMVVGEECLTEEDVLRYFETVHGFLDRNTENK